MKRKHLLVLAVLAIPGLAHALGLGELRLNSSLNQAFDARIELIAASAGELDSLNVGLADSEAFRRAGIGRPHILSKLRFEVVETESGADYIQITTRDGVREPFLNFLLEASWSNGRLYREYTVLLDPPLYAPESGSRAISDTYTPVSRDDSYAVDDRDSSSGLGDAVISYSGNEYGPTGSTDTLWSIASSVRPDSSVSVQQMMIALLRANPQAFINGNINGLKRGQILSIPGSDEINQLSTRQALSEVSAQNAGWQGTVAPDSDSLSTRADSMGVAGLDDSEDYNAGVIEDDESELRLVAASSDGAAQDGASGSSDSGVDLALANEELQAVKQENLDLKERNREAETIIQDLKRLIELKDNELAALQQQMTRGAGQDDIVEDGTVGDSVTFEEDMTAAQEDVVDEPVEDFADEQFIEEEVIEEDSEFIDDELVDEEVAEADTEAPAPAISTPPPSQSMVDKVLGIVMGNLILIAGALGAVIIAIVALLVISRRKQGAVEESTLSATEFPDFEDDVAASIEAPAADDASPEMEVTAAGSEDETVLPGEDEDSAPATAEAEPEVEVSAEEPAAEAPAPAAEEPEEEPLAEVNVLIAYEQFDQAEEFVRDAIAGSPDNIDYHSKLLEVFYAANDRKKYEEAAQVLHEKVNGEGPHWEIALAMWQEMSPGRALFTEGGDEEPADTPAAEGTGGIMDITAEDDEAGEGAGVDFDLGMDSSAGEGETAEATSADSGDEFLDLTADGEDESVLDVTTAATVGESTSDEDLLDVTAAVGLDAENTDAQDEDSDEQILDITAGADTPEEASDEDVLDISHGSGENLLDVTANANLESEGMEDDLLDVTAVGADADGEELLEVSAEDEASAEDDNSLDFDIGGLDTTDDGNDDTQAAGEEEASTEDDNSLDFDIGGLDTADDNSADAQSADDGEEDAGLSLETDATDDEKKEAAEDTGEDNLIDFDTGTTDDEVSLELDDEDSTGSDEKGLDLDSDTADREDGGLELDMDTTDEAPEEDDAGVELDLSLDDDGADDSTVDADDSDLSIDMEIADSNDTDEISIDEADAAQGGNDLEIDLSIDEDNTGAESPAADPGTDSADSSDDLEIDLTIDDDDNTEIDAGTESDSAADDIDLDFDLEIEDDDTADADIDMDGTVEMPKPDIADTGIEIDEDDDDDDDDDDHTVFVPRSGATDEQSAEDEIATKLDLAKAYVELGDKDSARGILDEVMADGNDEQKQTARELINQLG